MSVDSAMHAASTARCWHAACTGLVSYAPRQPDCVLVEPKLSYIWRLAQNRSDRELEAEARFAALAKELGVVLPISYYERANNAYYNSLAVADADGTIVGRYRKSHIPDGPGCALAVIVNPIDCGGCCRAHRQGTRSHGISGL